MAAATALAAALLATFALVGCVDEDDGTADGENERPIAELSVQTDATVGEPVVFDGSASSDPDGEIVWYTFDFGDGSAEELSPEPFATHRYAEAGEYSVLFSVVDDDGDKSSVRATLEISAP